MHKVRRQAHLLDRHDRRRRHFSNAFRMLSMVPGRLERGGPTACSFATPESANARLGLLRAGLQATATIARTQGAAPSTNWRGSERARRQIRQKVVLRRLFHGMVVALIEN
eukprot:7126691-Prymnesium_polylepis.4